MFSFRSPLLKLWFWKSGIEISLHRHSLLDAEITYSCKAQGNYGVKLTGSTCFNYPKLGFDLENSDRRLGSNGYKMGSYGYCSKLQSRKIGFLPRNQQISGSLSTSKVQSSWTKSKGACFFWLIFIHLHFILRYCSLGMPINGET